MENSPRLSYHPMTPEDLDFMVQYLADPVLTRFLPREKPYPLEMAVSHLQDRLDHWERHGFGTHLLRLIATGDPVGYCGLEYVGQTPFINIRYGITREHGGRGLATEACTHCLNQGFKSLAVPTLYGAAIPENTASIKVMEKSGMHPCQGVEFYGDSVVYFHCHQRE